MRMKVSVLRNRFIPTKRANTEPKGYWNSVWVFAQKWSLLWVNRCSLTGNGEHTISLGFHPINFGKKWDFALHMNISVTCITVQSPPSPLHCGKEEAGKGTKGVDGFCSLSAASPSKLKSLRCSQTSKILWKSLPTERAWTAGSGN